ncbi:MAG: MBL fold metallo-hydrolase [Dehalococcoidales bacterium]|nr:MBL fold metallo-hydrolase [Dehalococcoidales bacterium]
MKIKFLGVHNSESKKAGLLSLLIDDMLALDAGSLTRNLSFKAQQKLAAILLTHQHYDHIRDIPVMAMNLFLHETTINVYATKEVCNMLAEHLLNHELYRNFLEWPINNPTIKFNLLEPLKPLRIGDYRILPVPVSHSVPTVGLQVTCGDKTMFYTSDTGPGLTYCWQRISPQLLITETTAPNRYEDFGSKAKHLTPSLLKEELKSFREIKGYLPQVVIVHMNPRQEKEIAAEIAEVSAELGHPITLAHERMQIIL